MRLGYKSCCAMLLLWCALSARAQQTLDAQIAAHPTAPVLASGQNPGRVVMYRSGKNELKGTLYLPSGRGPFPVMLFNHGADKDPNRQPELAAFYNKHGFAFFVPLRRGHGGNPGETVDELLKPTVAANTSDRAGDEKFVRLLERETSDVAAGVSWLRQQPEINGSQIVMSGISYGGLDTFLSADTIPGVRAFVVFSGGARLWANPVLQKRLFAAAKHARAPIFLIQAANDYSTAPMDGLGPVLRQKPPPNRAKLYPNFGPPGKIALGHIGFATWNIGTDIWGSDVLAFLEVALQPHNR